MWLFHKMEAMVGKLIDRHIQSTEDAYHRRLLMYKYSMSESEKHE